MLYMMQDSLHCRWCGGWVTGHWPLGLVETKCKLTHSLDNIVSKDLSCCSRSAPSKVPFHQGNWDDEGTAGK